MAEYLHNLVNNLKENVKYKQNQLMYTHKEEKSIAPGPHQIILQ